MKTPLEIKIQLYEIILEALNRKIDDAKHGIASATESRDNDTKSSAGDKYETGRAMMQQEIDKNEMQLNVAMNQLMEMSRFDIKKKHDKVESGSLVLTDSGIYFISIGVGKIVLENKTYFAISMASPIGQLMKNKSLGEKIKFQGNQFVIKEVF